MQPGAHKGFPHSYINLMEKEIICVPVFCLYRDPNIEIRCTHAETNRHPNNVFLQGLRRSMLKIFNTKVGRKGLI